MRCIRPFPLLAAMAALLVSACLDDGPNRTGLGYLQDQGVRLSTPLYQLTLKDFPLESVFPQELPLNHFGESLLVVGRQGPFRATARFGYQINTQALRDSIKSGLSLSLRPLDSVSGFSFLDSSTKGLDSITVLVETLVWNDSSGTLADTATAYGRRIITATAPEPFSVFPEKRRIQDTVRIALDSAYGKTGKGSAQVFALTHLKTFLADSLAKDSTRNWLLYLELSPLPGAADSGMFRFEAGYHGTAYNTTLLLGPANDTAHKPLTLPPYLISTGYELRFAQSYQVFHSGPRDALLFGVSRGVHLRLNRQTLLDSIASAAQQKYGRSILGNSPTGDYDTRFFVPYAEIALPLDSSLAKVDGPFALDMQMISDVDSGAASSRMLSDTLSVGLDAPDSTLLVYSYSVSDPNAHPRDSLFCFYKPHPSDDPSVRRAIFHWSVAGSAYNDTFNVAPDRRSTELYLRIIPGETRGRSVSVIPDSNGLKVLIFFSTAGVGEPSFFLDSTGKNLLSSNKDLARRYWKPGAQELVVRSTQGLRTILNRNTSGCGSQCPDIAPDLLLKPADRRAFADTAYNKVPYPVLGEIGFPRQGGKVRVNVNLYLYPLRSIP